MSTLNVNDIIEATSGGSKIKFSRAYFYYVQSGGANTLDESFNLSSATDVGTGLARANLSTAFSTSTYVVNANNNSFHSSVSTSQILTTSFQTGGYNTSHALTDCVHFASAVGDQ